MFGFVIDYFLLIVIAFFGVLQIAASYSGLRGLSIFTDRKKGYLLGASFVVGAYFWFFGTGNRNIEGHITGVQGAQQFELFLAAAVADILVTAIIVSVMHMRSKGGKQSDAGPERGLEVLRENTFWQALSRYINGRR